MNIKSWRQKILPVGSSRESALFNSIILFILQGLNYLFPLITIPFLLRMLGMERWGIISLSMATVQYVILVSDYGLHYSAVRRLALVRDSLSERNAISSEILVAKGILFGISSFIFGLVVLAIPDYRAEYNFFLLALLLPLGWILTVDWFFHAMEKMKHSLWIHSSTRLLFMVSLFLMIRSPRDAHLYLLLNGSAIVLGGLIGIFVMHYRFSFQFSFPSGMALRRCYSDGWSFFLSNVSGTVQSSVATVVLGAYASRETVGSFAAAQRIFLAASSGMLPLIQALYPILTRAFQRDRSRSKEKAMLLLSLATICSIAIAGLVILLANPLAKLLSGIEAAEIAQSLQWLALSLPGRMVVHGMGGLLMFPSGMSNSYSRALLLGTLVTVLCMVILTPLYGLSGALQASLIAEYLTVFLLIATYRWDSVHKR